MAQCLNQLHYCVPQFYRVHWAINSSAEGLILLNVYFIVNVRFIYMLSITGIRITGGPEDTSYKLLIITSPYIVYCRLFLSSYILYATGPSAVNIVVTLCVVKR